MNEYNCPGIEFAIGALAAVGAGFFTNPIDVVKVRLQLQGELEARHAYKRIYKNTLHTAYLIVKHEGVLALQAGIVPALYFQLVLNGIRLGCYNTAKKYELITNDKGNTDILKTVMVTGTAGCIGAVLSSPFYMVNLTCYFVYRLVWNKVSQNMPLPVGIRDDFKSRSKTERIGEQFHYSRIFSHPGIIA